MDLEFFKKNKSIIVCSISIFLLIFLYIIFSVIFNSFSSNGLKSKEIFKEYFKTNTTDFECVVNTLLNQEDVFVIYSEKDIDKLNIENKKEVKKIIKNLFKNTNLNRIYSSKTYINNQVSSNELTTVVFALSDNSYRNYETTDSRQSREIIEQGIVYMSKYYDFVNYLANLNNNFYFYEKSNYNNF